MSRTGWLPVTAIAVLATIVIAVLASIGQGRELSSAAFLQQALAQAAERHYVQSTSSGTVTMLNGDVHRRHTESVHVVYDGDLRWRQWYEGCTYPHVMGTSLCSIEIVVHDNVRYQKVDTSEGPGEWEVMGEEWDPLEGAFENAEPRDIASSMIATGDMMELERETVDGVTYRRFQVTRRPGEDILNLIESGEWELPEPPEGFPDSFTVEDYVDALREMFETELFTDVYWVREDNRLIWRVHRQWEKTHPYERESAGALLALRSSTTVEYANYNTPVEIRPPIE